MPLTDQRVIDGIAALVAIAGKDKQIVHSQRVAEDYLARNQDCGKTSEELSQIMRQRWRQACRSSSAISGLGPDGKA